MQLPIFSEKILSLTAEAEAALAERFAAFDAVAFRGTQRVLAAFAEHRVSDSLFAGTTGYGYDDKGRETLDAIYADVFGAESAFVRHSIANGTQALTIGLFGLLRPGDILLSVTNQPYDTLSEVIGIKDDKKNGSLKDFGVEYRQIDLLPDGSVDLPQIAAALDTLGTKVKVVFIQRSKGYLNRPTLSVAEIGEIVKVVKAHSSAYVMVDNCYGEFTEDTEPTAVGADLIVGSLIKNPGGGMAESGGYLAGTARAVELASYRLTSPGVGLEVGATLGTSRSLYKGFFYAPHTVAQALKTAALAAYLFEAMGCVVSPRWNDDRHDIIQTVQCGTPEGLCAFCRGIQSGSPVDAFVTPEPWAMPGYQDEVIMAAGAFVQGSSIELSADGPLRAPYTAFLQGGLTYESGKIGIMRAADEMWKVRGGK
ncbi:MAG: methionine gamma-lyase family protein [Clostridia bacterium]|nr:methionine gamma-lyase family protein [Clostridia bacterium]